MFGPRTTPEPIGAELHERQRLERAAAEIADLQRQVDAGAKEAEGLREMNQVLSVAFRTSGHSALNRELEQLREALAEERLRSVEARAEVIRYDETERERRFQEEQRALEMESRASEGAALELEIARKTISGLRARIDDLETSLLKERQSVTRASAIVSQRHESRVIDEQRSRIADLEQAVADRDAKVHDLGRLLMTLQVAVAESPKTNPTLNFLRSV